MNKAIVTGGSGFIGSHIVEQLVRQGVETKVYDNLVSGSLNNLASVKSDINLIKADIRDEDALVAAIQGTDWVFHLAALTSVSHSIMEPLLTYEVNVAGTLNVLLAALKAGVSRVVIASSCAVYGDVHKPPLKETYLPMPKSPYAASKLTAEAYAESFYHSYGLESVCLRYFNVYGHLQRSDSDYAAAIPRFIKCYKNKQAPQVYGDGLQSRDFIHVTDVARASILAASSPKNVLNTSRVFNIGTGISTSILKLLEIISHQANCKLKPEFREGKKGDVRNSLADCTLAREKLGFISSVTLESGITSLFYKERLEECQLK